MKKLFYLSLLLILGGCSINEQGEEEGLKTLDYTVEIQGCDNVEKFFYSGTEKIGKVEVVNDNSNIYVTVLSNTANISEIRLALFTQSTMANLQGTALNNLVKYKYVPSTDSKTFTFPLFTIDEYGTSKANYPDGNVNILIRATIGDKTVWAEGMQFSTGLGQGNYFNYQIQQCRVADVPNCADETAYGYSSEISSPLNEFYSTPKNWGWYAELDFNNSVTYQLNLYAGAGQNDISKAVLAGTATLSLNNEFKIIDVTTNLLPGFTMGNLEVFTGDELPEKRPGPGQYTNSGDLNKDGRVVVIIHATICI